MPGRIRRLGPAEIVVSARFLPSIPPAGLFALFAALSSSVGQTFFIGLFGASFQSEFGLSPSAFGFIYGSVTLVSGLGMFWLGGLADHWTMARAIALTVVILAGGALLVGFAGGLGPLMLGLFALRLAGQGLAGHLAVVAAGRYTLHRRGRAMAMVTYGFIIGEACLPSLVALLMGWFDWRTVWLLAGLSLLGLALPLLVVLAGRLSLPRNQVVAENEAVFSHGPDTRRRLLGNPLFLRVLTIVLVPAMVVTAVFLHQGTLAALLGWRLTDIAAGFVLFALIQALFAFAGGRLIDRFSARSLLRFALLPAGLGLLSLSLVGPELSLWLMFAGVGMTSGLNGVISGAVWVELFGTARLGMIRGVYAALMVIGSALGPVLLGVLLEREVSLFTLAVIYLAYALVVPLLTTPSLRAIVSARGPV